MKKLLFSALFLVAMAAQAQNRAASCGGGCNFFPVTVKRGSTCGNTNRDMSFAVRNDWGRTAYIKLFIEVAGGVWKSAGYAALRPGQTNSDFWSCNNTGRYIVFYREDGTNDKMPDEAEVQSRM